MPTPSRALPEIDVLIVASWYPGADDPARGRFVADQAEALAATGRVRPLVLSFDPANTENEYLPGHAGIVRRHVEAALRAGGRPLQRRAAGFETGIPVGRLAITEPVGRGAPSGLDGDLRREALDLLADRFSGRRGIVHAHTGYPDGFAAAGRAARRGWPLVITEHATVVARQLRQPAQRQRYLEGVRAADRFIAVSQALADELRPAIPELGGKLITLPNTVAVERFRVSGLDGRKPDALLYVGYRKQRKGMITLLQAFADILEARPAATLRLVGRSLSDREEEQWHQTADDLGISHAVHFDEALSRDGVAAAMEEATLLVHPSPRETFGMTTLEALASGLPVVACRSGGIMNILEDTRLGELVEPGDSRALARGVLRALERRESFEPATLRAAVEPFSASSVAERLADLYAEILAETGGPTPEAASGVEVALEASAPAPIPASVLVFGMNTRRVARLLAPFPVGLLARVTLVTAGDGVLEELPKSLGKVVSVGPLIEAELERRGLHGPRGSTSDRVFRLLRHPVRAVQRRIASGGPTGVSIQAMRSAAVRAAAPRRRASGSSSRIVRSACAKSSGSSLDDTSPAP
jgi:glycogen(starch) synthase